MTVAGDVWLATITTCRNDDVVVVGVADTNIRGTRDSDDDDDDEDDEEDGRDGTTPSSENARYTARERNGVKE